MYQTSDNYKLKIYNTPHILKVFINDTEINSKYILDCKPSQQLFSNDEFTLGSVTAQAIDLKVYKTAVPDTINKVEIKSGITGEIIPVGIFNVDDISKDDDYTITLKLLDNMIKFEFNYDGSTLLKNNGGKAKIIQVLQDICLKAGVELGSTSFLNMNKEIAVYDSTISARVYLSYISEQAEGFACIGRNGKLYIKTIGETTATLPLKYFQNFKWGEKFKLTRVKYEDGIQLFEKGNTTGNTLYINQDNMFIVDQEQIDNIYDKIKDLEVYSFEGDSIIDPALDVGDILLIDNKKVIYQGSSQFCGKWKASISSKIQCKAKEETMSRTPSQKTMIRRVQSQIDQAEGKITQLAQETTEKIEQVQSQTDLNTDEIAKMGSTKTAEGTELNIDASKNPAHIKIWGKTEQATRSRNLFDKSTTKIGYAWTWQSGFPARATGYLEVKTNVKYKIKVKNLTLPLIQIQFVSELGSALTQEGIGFYSDGENEFVATGETKYAMIQFTKSTDDISENDYANTIVEITTDTPSPDYPSRIRNVGDNINLANLGNETFTRLGFENITNGSEWKISGTSTESNYLRTDFISLGKFKKGTYTFKIISPDITTTNIAFTIRNIVNNTNISSTSVQNKTINFTLEEETELGVNIWNNGVGNIINGTIYIKLEEGSMATPYTEYGCGSIDYRIDDNRFKTSNIEQGAIGANEGYTYEECKSANNTRIRTKELIELEKSKINSIRFNKQNYEVVAQYFDDNKELYGAGSGVSNVWQTDYFAFSNVPYVAIAIRKKDGTNILPNEIDDVDLRIITQEQTIHFPLSEGQLLHEEDYLAEDGIHNIRSLYIFSIDDDWQQTNNKKAGCFTLHKPNPLKEPSLTYTPYCTNLIGVMNNNYEKTDVPNSIGISGDRFNVYIPSATSIDECKTIMANQIVEYRLREEIITPLTPAQQKVIDNIETFKGQNYISCIDEIVPEKIEMEYYPNTPFNDTLVNKDTFDKVTSDMSAQINIKANEVETSVKESTTASILTLLNNGYLTAEQVNALVNGNAEDIAVVKEQLKQTITSSQMQIEITKALEGGVSYLKNTLFTIDDKGMAIATNQDEFNALYNNKGMYLYSFEQLIAKFDVNGATLNNLKILGEVETENLRMMNVSVSGVAHTHIHWIGG